MTNEFILVNEDITLLLVFPALDQMCTINDTNKSLLPHLNEKFTLMPIQIFEAISLSTYNLDFIRAYSKISIDLEIEQQLAQQWQRESLLNDEIAKSREVVEKLNKYHKTLEEIWKESRWITEAINGARERSSSSCLLYTSRRG